MWPDGAIGILYCGLNYALVTRETFCKVGLNYSCKSLTYLFSLISLIHRLYILSIFIVLKCICFEGVN